MLTALRALNAQQAMLVRYATSADISEDTSSVVGYAGFIFSE
jgi:AmmeMemoRadiSam system protein B